MFSFGFQSVTIQYRIKQYNVVIACGDYKHGIVKLCEKANISLFLGVFTAGTQHTNYFLYLFG